MPDAAHANVGQNRPAPQGGDPDNPTQVDRLKADPFAFYAQSVLRLRSLDPVDDDHTARWKGSAVHEVFEHWLREDDCDPGKLRSRAMQLLSGEAIHTMETAKPPPCAGCASGAEHVH